MNHDETLTFLINVHDAATRNLQRVSGEVDRMAQSVRANLASLQAETAKLTATERASAAEAGKVAAAQERAGVATKGHAAEAAALTGRTRAGTAAFAEHSAAVSKHTNLVSRMGLATQQTGSHVQQFGRSISGLSLPLAAVGALSIKSSIDFQRSMELVSTQAGASQKEVDRLKGKVLDLAPAVGVGPNKLAEGLYHIESAGIRGAKAMDVLKVAAEGAAVGHTDMESVSNALVAILKTQIGGVHDAADAMGQLNTIVGLGNMRMGDLVGAIRTGIVPSARAAGLSLRDVGAAIDIMTERGVPAEDAATRLRMTFALMDSPTGKAKKAFEAIGLTSRQLADDMRKPNGLLIAVQDLSSHLKGSGADATEQTQILQHAFGGGRTSSAILTLVQNVDKLKTKYDDLGKADGAKQFADAVEKTHKTSAHHFAQMQAELQVAAIKLGDSLLPVATDIAKGLVSVVHGFNDLPKGAQHAIEAFAGVAAVAGPLAIMIGGMVKGVGLLGRGAGKLGGFGGIASGTGGGAAGVAAALKGTPENPLYVVNMTGPGVVPGAAGSAASTAESAAMGGGLAASAKAGAKVAGARLVRAAGIGLVAVPLADFVGNQVGGGGGQAIGGAGAGAAIGSIAGLPGAAVGAGLGALIGPGMADEAKRAAKRYRDTFLSELKVIPAITPLNLKTNLSELKTLRDSGFLTKKQFDDLGKTFKAVSSLNFTFAEAFQKEALKLGKVNAKMLSDINTSLGQLPPNARAQAANAVIGMAAMMEKNHQLPVGSASNIRKDITKHFRGMNVDSVHQALLMELGVGGATGDMASSVNQTLGGMAATFNAFLHSMGVAPVKFNSAGAIGIPKLSKTPPKGATGMRVPGGEAGPDNVGIFDHGGALRGLVAPGELLVANRHTESRVDRMLAAYGTTLGAEVAGERRPHSHALGGVIPAFATGGGIRAHTTAYGPPWGGIEGGGQTASGINLANSPHLLILAAPPQYPFHSRYTMQPNPFGTNLPFTVEDRGGAIQGNHFDTYVWQGHGFANTWGDRSVTLTPAGHGPPYTLTGAVGPMGAGGAGGPAPQLARKILHGPAGALTKAGQGVLDKALHHANAYLTAHQPAGGGGGSGGPMISLPPGSLSPDALKHLNGIVNVGWSGGPLAAWIAYLYKFGRSQGWDGDPGQMGGSGYRSKHDQFVIGSSSGFGNPYNSHHMGTQWPGGAIDIGDPGSRSRLLNIIGRSPYHGMLGSYSGGVDPVHLSSGIPWGGTSWAKGGRIPFAGAFGDGGTFSVNQPTAFIAGDKGPETVSVVPHFETGGNLQAVTDYLYPKAKGKKGRQPPRPTEQYNPLTDRIEIHTPAEWRHIHAELAKYRHDHKGHAPHTKPKHPLYEEPIVEDLGHGKHQVLGEITGHAKGVIHIGTAKKVQDRIRKLATKTWNQIASQVLKAYGTEDVGHQLTTLGGLIPKHQHQHLTTRLREVSAKMIGKTLTAIGQDEKAHQDIADKAIKDKGLQDKNKGWDDQTARYWTDQVAVIAKHQKDLYGDKAHLNSLLSAARRAHDAKAIPGIKAKLADVQTSIDQGISDGIDARQKIIDSINADFDRKSSDAGKWAHIIATWQHNAGTDNDALSKLKDKQGGFLNADQQHLADSNLLQFVAGVRNQQAPLQQELGYDQSIVGTLHGTAYNTMQSHILDLIGQISDLESSITDQTSATNDLKASTDANTKATDGLTGSVTYQFQGQDYVVGQDSTDTANLSTGV